MLKRANAIETEPDCDYFYRYIKTSNNSKRKKSQKHIKNLAQKLSFKQFLN